jgi:hypothetical protein
MKLRKTIVALLILAATAIPAALITWLALSGPAAPSAWSAIAVVSPLIALLSVVALLPILLRPTARTPRRPASVMATGISIGATITGYTLMVVGIFMGNIWLMAAGMMLAPLLHMLRDPPPASGMKAGQFTLRRLFFITTFLAVLIGFLTAIDRWKNNSIRERNESTARANHEIEVKGYQAKVELLESYRGKISPEAYEQRRKELDEEAAKLNLP